MNPNNQNTNPQTVSNPNLVNNQQANLNQDNKLVVGKKSFIITCVLNFFLGGLGSGHLLTGFCL